MKRIFLFSNQGCGYEIIIDSSIMAPVDGYYLISDEVKYYNKGELINIEEPNLPENK